MSKEHTQQLQQDQTGRSGRTQPAEVPPSTLNEGDRGAADSPPTTSEQLNFDDASEDHPRGNTSRTGGTWDTPDHNTGDQGEIKKAPGAGLSDTNSPSDPSSKNDLPPI